LSDPAEPVTFIALSIIRHGGRMTAHRLPEPGRRIAACVVLLLACAIAVVSARDYAGGWNDRSRLATVESLVDHGTLAIDQSIFAEETADKLFIRGHYYSDKSPVPALALAGVYKALQTATGWTAREQTDTFCRVLNLSSAGLAYVLAVWCVYRLGVFLGLRPWPALGLTASFALTTVAPAYARHVNNHVLLLAVTAGLALTLARIAAESTRGIVRARHFLAAGSLVGIGYTFDLGAGPVLLLGTLVLVVFRTRRLRFPALTLLAALPWLVLHHALNYAVGGTFAPANSVAEYFNWPGCPFTPATMTGGWKHTSVGHFLLYAASLLLGKRGFIGHNLPLFLALAGAVWLLRRRPRERPEVLFAVGVSAGVWLVYAANSNNSSGPCCSIRWFVPLLAPGYHVLALWLRERPDQARALAVLSGWGAILAAVMWWEGPWMMHLVPGYWPVQGMALLTWAWTVRHPRRPVISIPATLPRAA
jgi:hypothetical protein